MSVHSGILLIAAAASNVDIVPDLEQPDRFLAGGGEHHVVVPFQHGRHRELVRRPVVHDQDVRAPYQRFRVRSHVSLQALQGWCPRPG
jgi:hypothetical protein